MKSTTLPMCHGTKLIIDLFAGGGGWSTGVEQAFHNAGSPRLVDIAVNHNQTAIACHKANHPQTVHHIEDVFKVRPLEVTGGLPVGYLHASPDCTHHSKARGGKPVKKRIRGLAWVVIRWARQTRPDVITLENVEEFKSWGPLLPNDTPDPKRAGQTFRTWRTALERLGYQVESRELIAADYGAPTSRKRLFIVARRDGKPIVWPAKTHGKGIKPYRTAAECIDWTLPACSIFATKEEAKAWGKAHGRASPIRPLAGNTLRRIANGVMRYVVNSKRPFVVTCNHAGAGFRGQPLDEPMGTITGARDAHGVIQPILQRADQVAALISKHYTGVDGHAPDRPLGTITGIDHHALTVAHLTKFKFKSAGAPVDAPCPTITAGGAAKRPAGNSHALAVTTACLTRIGQTKFSEDPSRAMETPLSTIVGKAEHLLATAHMVKLKGTCADGQPVDAPAPTICGGGNHAGLVLAFLQKYYGNNTHGQDLNAPLHTIPGVDRFGLVTVSIDGESWVITDICMRMLAPTELALCQGFPPNYILDRVDGRALTGAEQVKLIGNSVPPPVAEAIVAANVVPMFLQAKAAKRAMRVA